MPPKYPEHLTTPEYSSPLIERLKLKEQYGACVAALNEAGLLELLEDSGRTGIVGIDNKEYILPRYSEITQEIAQSESWLESKERQGFTELSIVPIALPLGILFKRLECAIKQHGENKTILSPGNPPTPLDVDLNQPLYRDDLWERSDTEGTLLYYPKKFEKESGGMTKKDLLASLRLSPFPGWLILLEEPTEIPAKGETHAKRKQLEANHTSKEYLHTLSETPYLHEEGLTIEGWIARFLTRLHTKNEVVDDWEGIGKSCYLIGNYNFSLDRVPFGSWHRDGRQASIVKYKPDYQGGRYGARSAVRIGNA